MNCKHCQSTDIRYTEQLVGKNTHVRATCMACEKGLGFVSQNLPPGKFKFFSGKHNGETVEDVWESDQNYITWCIENYPNPRVQSVCREFVSGLLKSEGVEVPDKAINA